MKKKHSKKPQKGDPDYLTPTQLRNRRKRRAKQRKQHGIDDQAAAVAAEGSNIYETPNNKKNHHTTSSEKDPSMKYISDPAKAPIVQAAQKYFKPVLQECATNDFHVHLGPLSGWRTVSKLAVRPDVSSAMPKVAIGLFLPQSHTLLPVPNCRAHHPSINSAVKCVTRACHEVGVVPYQAENVQTKSEDSDVSNEKGTGQLRYIAINVARETGATQITLVWNKPPPPDSSEHANKSSEDEKEGKGSKRKHGETTLDDPVLDKLVTKIIAMSKNGSNDKSNIEEGMVATDDVNHISKSADEQTSKKNRRRGRREGKSIIDAQQTGSDGNEDDTRIIHKDTSHTTTIKGGGSQPRFNLHSVWINYNQSWKHSSAIFSYDTSCWQHVYGPRAIIEHLTFGKAESIQQMNQTANPKPPSFSIPLTFPPNVFRQANLDAFTDIVGRIRERVQKLGDDNSDITCVELYGGVGTIGLHLSDVVASLVSSDENQNNAKCFYESVRTLPANIQPRLSYLQKNAADMVMSEQALFRQSQVLIVDPPRKGLDDEVVDYLCKTGYKTLKLVVYVSCGFQAFQRDCNALIKSGRWKVEFAEGYILFPGSDAIETLTFFVPS